MRRTAPTARGRPAPPWRPSLCALGTSVHLKVSFDGQENATFSFSADGCTWQVVGTPISVGLDGQVDLSWRLQAWTGATIGLFAVKQRGDGRQLRRLRGGGVMRLPRAAVPATAQRDELLRARAASRCSLDVSGGVAGDASRCRLPLSARPQGPEHLPPRALPPGPPPERPRPCPQTMVTVSCRVDDEPRHVASGGQARIPGVPAGAVPGAGVQVRNAGRLWSCHATTGFPAGVDGDRRVRSCQCARRRASAGTRPSIVQAVPFQRCTTMRFPCADGRRRPARSTRRRASRLRRPRSPARRPARRPPLATAPGRRAIAFDQRQLHLAGAASGVARADRSPSRRPSPRPAPLTA